MALDPAGFSRDHLAGNNRLYHLFSFHPPAPLLFYQLILLVFRVFATYL